MAILWRSVRGGDLLRSRRAMAVILAWWAAASSGQQLYCPIARSYAINENNCAVCIFGAQGQDLLIARGVVPRPCVFEVGKFENDHGPVPVALQYLGFGAVDQEAALKRCERRIDALQIEDNVGPHFDRTQLCNTKR